MMNKRYNYPARHLSNTARGLADTLRNDKRQTIGTIRERWNNVIKTCGYAAFGGDVSKFELIIGYSRKISLIADLENIADYLFNLAEAKETVYDVETAHAMALLDNLSIDAQTRVRLFPETVVSEKEAHEIAATVEGRRRVAAFFGGMDFAARREALEAAHAEAMAINDTTTNTENVIPMNKAKAKQNQTPDNLPRLQLVDVMRAFLRSVPTSSQEQIEAVGDLSHKELRNLIIKMTAKGARVTAHLTKSKSAGYGFLTFGYNGQLPPGTYHKIVVSNMKNARDVASQYGAVMWNF